MKAADFKKGIDVLCDYALDHSEEPEKFDINDLSNATVVFQHVFGNLHFEFLMRNKFSMKDACDRSLKFGKQMRQMIIDGTGLDLHETFGSTLDAEVVED